jgi:L-ribulose-5-phosphate 3-epimerase
MKDKRFSKGYSLVVHENDITGFLPAIAEAGFDGVEPTFVTGALPSPENHLEEARRLRAVCDGLGLAVPSMRGGRVPWTTIISADAGERARALEHTRRACETLTVLGGSVLLVVPGERTPGIDLATHWHRVVDYGRAAADIAAGFGMRIGLENVEARFPSSERDWLALIEEIGSDRLGIYLDVGNVLWMGFGYPEDWIRTLGKHIVQVHFKDASYRLYGATLHAEIRQLLDGEVNWPEVMRALDEISYRGWISVEPESYRHLPERLPRRLASDLDALFKLGTGGT